MARMSNTCLAAFLLCLTLLGPAWGQDSGEGAESVKEADGETGANEDQVVDDGAGEKRTHKSGFRRKARFGGPNSPEGLIEEDDVVKQPVFRFREFDESLHPWFDWKAGVSERHGLQLSGHYASLYQGLSDSLTEEDEGWSGLFRLNTRWALVGRGGEGRTRVRSSANFGGEQGARGRSLTLFSSRCAIVAI